MSSSVDGAGRHDAPGKTVPPYEAGRTRARSVAVCVPGAPRFALAVVDLIRGARMTRLWCRLGWQDVRHRYRRSMLGPWWITVGTGVMIVLLGALYGGLFRQRTVDHLPYVAAGLVVWGLIASLVTEGCGSFLDARRIVHQVALPLSLHAYRLVWRTLLAFAHSALLLPVVAVGFGVWPGWTGLLAVPGLAAICLNGVWVALVCGTLTARFRDVPPILESVMRLAFLATPIVWTPALLPERAWLVAFNPFHHLLEVVRAPLLGELPAAASWGAVGAITVLGWALALVLYARCRARIAYWL